MNTRSNHETETIKRWLTTDEGAFHAIQRLARAAQDQARFARALEPWVRKSITNEVENTLVANIPPRPEGPPKRRAYNSQRWQRMIQALGAVEWDALAAAIWADRARDAADTNPTQEQA